MRGNRVKELIDGGGLAVNAWVSCDRVITLLQAVSAGPAMPMVRCSHLDVAEIGKLLDAGAYGLICPSIDTAEQCVELVAACRYPPVGRRSFGPSRGLLYGGPDYVDHANDTVSVWAMIESREALENLHEIVAVPGLDGVYVGPNDMALSLGVAPATSPVAAEVREALSRVLEVGHAAGVPGRAGTSGVGGSGACSRAQASRATSPSSACMPGGVDASRASTAARS